MKKLIASLLLITSVSGCGTFISIKNEGGLHKTNYFDGSTSDLENMNYCVYGIGISPAVEKLLIIPCFFGLAIDLPFSFLADLLVLPLQIVSKK